eukprot:CAMPEP_0198278292 /NCGR_PEP_ID=MMETSP1447-20131203/66302_1 /TAXON_ID=420782 /ORGANISM="Chaetoceros dichaeta, Strain CCMP1751" /LENGTH=202 /DNA_ID=CAMNT_0043973367 /DNA_START=383 /DNA_END=991 /DNA_ORIENTATION=-
MIFAIPLLMIEYSNILWMSSVLTFMTVTCLAGLHEVARELENPFRNIPNDIPLNTLQAMFNESLLTVYSGYHPDHYWKGDEYRARDAIHEVSPSMNGVLSSNKLRPPKRKTLSSTRLRTPRRSHVKKKALSSNRLRTPPQSPVRRKESGEILSSQRNTETPPNDIDKERAVSELQQLVKKQSDEIARLSNPFQSPPSPIIRD